MPRLYRQTDIHTNRQRDRHTDRQTDKMTTLLGRNSTTGEITNHISVDAQVIQTDRQIGRQTDRQVDRWTDRPIGRQTDTL